MTSATRSPSAPRTSIAASPARLAATAFGVVFLAVGILGFVPGITSNLQDITFMGHESGAELLGLFQVSILHNIVHTLFGVVGLIVARTSRTSVAFLIGGGIVYLALTAYGVVIDHASAANFVPLNGADNVLHLGLGVAMVGLGLAVSGRTSRDW
ncbi:MAG: DUF4383 domain-containing protein [Actinomycetota bacterium]|nr:DUF4383 domain-containing protein [Actinomycetota bacterium]MDQ3575030.1 DUF4383 domain-containing protein [Actinomycetota bacterium]